MSKLTKRQHYVPEFYLNYWAVTDKKLVAVHDLIESRTFTTGTNNTLNEHFLYEDNPEQKDNRIENWLRDIENSCAPQLNSLYSYYLDQMSDYSSNERIKKTRITQLQNKMTDDLSTTIKKFALSQYLRVPLALEQKKYELGSAQAEFDLTQGAFLETGYQYNEQTFQNLKILLVISEHRDFVTSDCPCFDMNDSKFAPLLGEAIGRDHSVIAVLPINPKMAAIFYPPNHLPIASKTPDIFAMHFKDADVRNMNNLVIQQADRYVIAAKEESYIFKIASKRIKASAP